MHRATGTGKTASLSRHELYDLVWSEPMRTIAPRFGVSDVALAKLCRRVAIPLPPLGYWAKIQHGKRIRRPPLPEKPRDRMDPVSITASGYRKQDLEASLPDDIKEAIATERDETNPVIAPKRVRTHPIIRRWMLEDAQSSGRGHYRPHRPSQSSIEKRRLRFFSMFFREIERRSGSVEAESRWKFALVVAGEKLQVSVDESLKQVRVPETDHWAGREWRMENQPTGLLRLRIEMYFHTPIRKQWHDRPGKLLEQQICEIIIGLLFASAVVRTNRLAGEKREREAARAETRRLVEEQRLRAERAKLQDLLEQTASWNKARDIRRFVSAALRAGSERGNDLKQFKSWAKWARVTADSIDPLCLATEV